MMLLSACIVVEVQQERVTCWLCVWNWGHWCLPSFTRGKERDFVTLLGFYFLCHHNSILQCMMRAVWWLALQTHSLSPSSSFTEIHTQWLSLSLAPPTRVLACMHLPLSPPTLPALSILMVVVLCVFAEVGKRAACGPLHVCQEQQEYFTSIWEGGGC